MIIKKSVLITAIAIILTSAACSNNNQSNAITGDTSVKKSNIPATEAEDTVKVKISVINVNDSISITLNSNVVSLENLAATLTQLLVLKKDIPDEIPVEYKGEVLMGMRSQITTEINAGIKNAKVIKYKLYADAVVPLIAKEVKVPVDINIQFFRRQGNDAFLSGIMMDPAGYELELNKTPHAREAEGGSYSNSVFALLHYQNGAWGVTTISIGATDVPMVCWWKEFNLPKSLFPADMAASDCQ